MKATITFAAALVASACFLGAARAQAPLIVPVGHAASSNCGCGAPTGGGGGSCASGNCGHKPSLYTKLFHKNGSCGDCNNGGKCLSWLCRPNPSNAPSCFKADYPLGFPNSPYVRSPRDYFMYDHYGQNAGYGFGY